MPRDFSHPAMIKFLTEKFDMENERRMVWFLKNKDKIEKAASFPADHKSTRPEDVIKSHVDACLPMITTAFKATYRNRRKRHQIDGILIGLSGIQKDKKLEPEINAKPVDEGLKKILTTPLPDGGRKQYLKQRKRILPENKYENTETSSHVVGWRFRDSWVRLKAPTYARYYRYTDDSMSRTGPHPDPNHYIPLLSENNCICFQ